MKTALLGMTLVAALSACADERPEALASATAVEPERPDDAEGTDLRQLTVAVMLGEDIPETGATCIIERMDDDLLRRFWVEVQVHLEDLDSLDESPILGELALIFDACAESLDTTDI